MELAYKIHDILSVKIRVRDPHLLRNTFRKILGNLNFSYLYFFNTHYCDTSDITLNIERKVSPSISNCYVIWRKYYIKDNYIYIRNNSVKEKWEAEIINIEKSNTTINYNGRIISLRSILLPDFFPQNFLLRPIVEFKLLQRNYIPIHASAVARKRDAIMFAGPGGTFKTSIAMDFVRQGFKLLGDDTVLLDKRDSKLLSYPIYILPFNFKLEKQPSEIYRGTMDKISYLIYMLKKRNIN